MTYIDRPAYLPLLDSYAASPLAKVLTGVRRCGKSSLLKMLRENLVQRGTETSRIIALDFDELENAPLANATALHEYIMARAPIAGPYFVLLDEIQEVDEWERLVSSLIAHGRASIYLTGSNSRLLSSEFGTYLTGRYVGIDVAPLTFREFCSFVRSTRRDLGSETAIFQQYARQGGLPGLFAAPYTDAQTRQILLDTYSSILTRDIITRRQIRSPELFTRVAAFALDNVGNTFSAYRVSQYLKAQGKTLTHQTVADYLEALTEAYVLRKVTRYDVRGHAHLQTQEKYYAGDHGFITGVLGYNASRLPGILENIVQAELRSRGYQVFIGKVGTQEVDFVGVRDDERIYLQVSVTALDPGTYAREMAPLLAIQDSYPKYLLTLDELAGGVDQGIRFMKLPDFLLADGWSQ